MLVGTYAILRFIANPWRDEPINIGIVIAGPAGASLHVDDAAPARMQAADPCLDPAVPDDLRQYLHSLLTEPVLHLRDGRLEPISPADPAYLPALAELLPRRFALGQPLSVELADTQPETQARTAAELIRLVVTPAATTTTTGV